MVTYTHHHHHFRVLCFLRFGHARRQFGFAGSRSDYEFKMCSLPSSTNLEKSGVDAEDFVGDGNSTGLKCLWIDCKATYTNQGNLVNHINGVHVETRREDFVCLWHACPRRRRPFNARYKLLIHMRVHTGFKPNTCSFPGCSKSFSRLENLKIHMRSHTGEKPYVCPFCPKGFSNSSDRAKHQRTHFDRKPYACSYGTCVKRYTDPSSLRKHFKTHFKDQEIMSPTVSSSSSSSSTDVFTFDLPHLPLQNLDDLVTWSEVDEDWTLPMNFLEGDTIDFSELLGL